METTRFALTPAQKDFLASLARETGKTVPALLDEALEGLQTHVSHHPGNGAPHGRDADQAVPPPHETQKPFWEQICDAFAHVSDEELAALPEDGAAQVDHYVYGLPKR